MYLCLSMYSCSLFFLVYVFFQYVSFVVLSLAVSLFRFRCIGLVRLAALYMAGRVFCVFY